MAIFRVNLTATNPNDTSKKTKPFAALVDTGSHLSWLPRQALIDAGIVPKGQKRFINANSQLHTRDIGYAILTAEKYSTIDEVVFAEKGDHILHGVRTIEGFGMKVDNINGRFEPVDRFFTGIRLVHEGEEIPEAQEDMPTENEN